MASRSSLAVSVSQVSLLTYKNFVGLEKRKVNAIVCVLYEKRRLQMKRIVGEYKIF